MAILRQDQTGTDLRHRLIEEAEEHRRRHPVPPMEEVLEDILRRRSYRPADHGAPDSTTLLREDRGALNGDWVVDASVLIKLFVDLVTPTDLLEEKIRAPR